MGLLHIVRYALLATVLLFSLIVLGISANFIHLSNLADGSFIVFEALAVAVALLTFITIIPILVIDFLRKGAFTSLVVFELGWVFILMVLWIASAADTSSTSLFVSGCSDFGDDVQSICHQYQAIEAFSWLIFIILFGWLVTLIVSAVIAHTRGHTGVWTSPVSDTAFFGGVHSTGANNANTANNGGYPPQLQHAGHPQQMHQQGGYPAPPPGAQQAYPTPPPGSQQAYPTPPLGSHSGYQGTPPPGYGVAQV